MCKCRCKRNNSWYFLHLLLSFNTMKEIFYHSIKKELLDGRWPIGQQLPTLKALAIEFGAAPITVFRGIKKLAQEGLVHTCPGKGIFNGPRQSPDRLAGKPRTSLLWQRIQERLGRDCITKVEVIDFPELGMEAVHRIEVENFPAFIIVDDKGNDFFEKFRNPPALTELG